MESGREGWLESAAKKLDEVGADGVETHFYLRMELEVLKAMKSQQWGLRDGEVTENFLFRKANRKPAFLVVLLKE